MCLFIILLQYYNILIPVGYWVVLGIHYYHTSVWWQYEHYCVQCQGEEDHN